MKSRFFYAGSQHGVLALEGDLTIRQVSELKQVLVDAFDKADEVTVDLSAMAGIDVAGLQLLGACHSFTLKRGKKMCLDLGENASFMDFLAKVGFALDYFIYQGKAGKNPEPVDRKRID